MKKEITYSKPNMTNLHGRLGRRILEQIRTNIVPSDENIRREAEECKKRLMAKKSMKNEIL